MAFEFEFNDLLKQVVASINLGVQSEMEQLCKEYNTSVSNLVKSGWVTSNCSDIIFINYTPLTVTVNGNVNVDNYTLQPGGFLSITGNNAEINKTSYNVVFQSAATTCIIIKKLYTKK